MKKRLAIILAVMLIATTCVPAMWANMFDNSSAFTASAATKQLAAPTNVKASASELGIKVSWSKVKNAKTYYVYRATKKDGKFSKIGSTKDTKYTDVMGTVGKTYYYKVKAYKTDKYSTSKYSGVKSAKFVALSAAATAEAFLKSIQKKDYSNIKNIYSGDKDNDSLYTKEGSEKYIISKNADDVIGKAIRTFKFEIVEESVDGDKANVGVKISRYKYDDIFNEALKQATKEAEQYAVDSAKSAVGSAVGKVTSLVTKKDTKKEEVPEFDFKQSFTDHFIENLDNAERTEVKTVKLPMTKVDGKWKVDDLSGTEFDSMLRGGLTKAVDLFKKAAAEAEKLIKK